MLKVGYFKKSLFLDLKVEKFFKHNFLFNSVSCDLTYLDDGASNYNSEQKYIRNNITATIQPDATTTTISKNTNITLIKISTFI